MTDLRAYGTLLTDATAVYLNIPKYATPTEFATSSDWTPAAGDVKVSKDGAAAANITNLPTYVADVGWRFILTAAELTAKQVVVRIADAATKQVVDDMFTVETVGHASSMWPDPDSTSPVAANLVRISGDANAVSNLLNDYSAGVGFSRPDSTIGLVDGAITAAKIAANAITSAGVAADAVAEIADAVWDEPSADHSVAGSFGGLSQLHTGAAQAAGSSTLTLAASASATNDIYNGRLLVVTAGTGAGQIRRVTGYVGSTKVATLSKAWETTPDTTSEYAIVGN